MIDRAGSKITNIMASALAFVLMLPLALTNYLFARAADLGGKVDIDPVNVGAAHKYGGPTSNYNDDLLMVANVFGRVMFGESKKPAKGVYLRVIGTEAEAVEADADGNFRFKPFYCSAGKGILAIRESKTGQKILCTMEIDLVKASTLEISL